MVRYIIACISNGVVCMPREHESCIYEILSILDGRKDPLGSGQLKQMLAAKGYELSEATVGRILSSMDCQNLTQKVGFQGRVITETGKARLGEIKTHKQHLKIGTRLVETVESAKRDDIIDILVARKAIERELARLAAINATEADILKLEEALDQANKQSMQSKEISLENDIKFHHLLGLAAKNKVLVAALDLIRHDEQLSPVLEYIRKKVGRRDIHDHGEIVKAIRERNPDRAEQAMVQHVDSLINNIKKHWSIVN